MPYLSENLYRGSSAIISSVTLYEAISTLKNAAHSSAEKVYQVARIILSSITFFLISVPPSIFQQGTRFYTHDTLALLGEILRLQVLMFEI
ncbi:MAG TPA: hypothetical protein P5048_03435 [Chlamydiales bacterium]|mgnify:CR=1 FL=1|nr:hypothetical protein [Chlamydiales bacterium]